MINHPESTSENDILLEAKDLYFSYDGEKDHSLNGLSLKIKRGRKVAFMGANGSGKSTFFLCCNGIYQPSRGQLYFGGRPVEYTKEGLLELRSKVRIVFQDPDNQLFSASVYQEISFGILNLGVDEAKAKEEVESVIDKLEITPFRHKPTHALSGGQKKQVSIADILVMHPDIIILDEPAAALDPRHATLVDQIVDQLTADKITVMMATHDADYTLAWADDVVLFKDGQVLTSGSPLEVFNNYTALAETNLEQPAVLQLFHGLCKKGILTPALPLPRNLKTLEGYIADVNNAVYFGGETVPGDKEKKAILVVSFGTSYEATRKVTIDAIENDIADAYPEHKLYRAWTSKMILAKLKKRDKLHINNVKEAMEEMVRDGITDIIVQPTHVINGIENELMKEDALAYSSHLHSIRFGTPLLTSGEDNALVMDAITREFSYLKDNEVLVLMGHGTTHYSNAIYAALDYAFKDTGHPHIFLGTVEAYPSVESLKKMIARFRPEKVYLAPFMIVAGDHARNDMAGDDPKSWYSQFTAEGYTVEPVLKGLGEYEGIRRLFIRHIADAM